MSNSALTSVLFVLFLLVGLAQLLGWLFVKMRQPKVVGEILAGVVLGHAVLGRLPAIAHLMQSVQHQGNILDFVYWMGLLLLMFLAGAETQQLFTREERREVGWLTIVGTGLPFRPRRSRFAPWIIRPSLAGPNGNRISLTIILAVGVAVTSVPVVSKIFADLKILHTRFARLVLGVAVLEDIVSVAGAGHRHGDGWQSRSASARHVAAPARHGDFFVLASRSLPRVDQALQQGALQRRGPDTRPSAMPSPSCSPIAPSPEPSTSAWSLPPSWRASPSSTRSAASLPTRSTPSAKSPSPSSSRSTSPSSA